ncbi:MULTISPECIES: FliH/SctL family protein [unclassified Fusibacter]|uniref:FliH/SctL family protein n=1 Tax=unclassified Fusibacter TaxID=2624464 RepID=UPI0013E91242|nr:MULTISPECIES: FliH/SctL family protein [unclassified Fusibacter]MCK8058756.1 FliH/SctL family protein [Fusibacter sp. A2]NPE21830.1 hypothetical protein [Fusibacter sp. A1]
MSKLIKSSRIILGDDRFKISAEITMPVDQGFHPSAFSEDRKEVHGNIHEDPDAASPESLIEQAEDTVMAMLDQAQVEADQIIQNARMSADQIENEALDKVKAIFENTKAEAMDKGYAEGYNEGRAEAQVLIDEALMIKEELRLQKESLVKDLEIESVQLVLSIVENILGKETENRGMIIGLVEKGLSHLTYTTQVAVRVSEDDYEFVVESKPKILAMVENVDDVIIKKDMSLKRGDCIIDADAGSIDVSLNSQAEQVRSIFEALLASE